MEQIAKNTEANIGADTQKDTCMTIPQDTIDFLTTKICKKCEANYCTKVESNNIFIKFCGVDYVIKYNDDVQKFLNKTSICDCCKLQSDDGSILLTYLYDIMMLPNYRRQEIYRMNRMFDYDELPLYFRMPRTTYDFEYKTCKIILSHVNIISKSDVSTANAASSESLITHENIELVFACINAKMEFKYLNKIVETHLGIKVSEFLTLDFFNNAKNIHNFSVAEIKKVLMAIVDIRVKNRQLNLDPLWRIDEFANNYFVISDISYDYRISIERNIINGADTTHTLVHEYKDLLMKFDMSNDKVDIIKKIINVFITTPSVKNLLMYKYIAMFVELLPQPEETVQKS